MGKEKLKISVAALLLCLMLTVVFTVQDSYAAPAATKAPATTKAADKPKTVAINIAILSETQAEVDIIIEKVTKKKTYSFERTVTLKKGANYFSYDKGTKGYYRVKVNAFGDVSAQGVTAIQGKYTLLFQVAPPTDGDSKKTDKVVYQDLTKIKKKK